MRIDVTRHTSSTSTLRPERGLSLLSDDSSAGKRRRQRRRTFPVSAVSY